MTQEQLAHHLGVTQPRISALLRGEGTGDRHLSKLAQGLGVPLEWLADGSNPPSWLRRQRRDLWPKLALKVAKASGTEMGECVNLRADQLHARATAAGCVDFPSLPDLQKILVEHVAVIQEEHEQQEGRNAAYREIPREEYEGIILALKYEYARAAVAHRSAGPDQSDIAVRHLITVRKALANFVYLYVFANHDQFPGGIDGPHGIELIRKILDDRSVNWFTLGIRFPLVEDV